jgi:SAM-dependent methyltransferase
MITNIRHTGIVVHDLDKSLHFYRDLLGFKINKMMVESGEYIDNISRLTGVKVTTVKLSAPDGNLIELLYFHSHQYSINKQRELFDAGFSHIALSVSDLEKEYHKLIEQGVFFNAPPQFSPDGYAKVTFCKDPDNNFIELVEVINPMCADYVSVIYEINRTPPSDYPLKLASYLCNRFSIERGSRLLEVGCGRGDFLKAFQKLGIDCSAVDLCSSTSNLLCNIEVRNVDISKDKLPYEDNFFDIVYHKSLIEHLYSPDNLMRETFRVLKPGGRVIMLVPDWHSQMKVFYEDYTHCRPYDTTSLNDVLRIYGFSKIETELFYQLPAVWKYPRIRIICKMLQLILSVPLARKLSNLMGVKFFRWSVELMVLGTGRK